MGIRSHRSDLQLVSIAEPDAGSDTDTDTDAGTNRDRHMDHFYLLVKHALDRPAVQRSWRYQGKEKVYTDHVCKTTFFSSYSSNIRVV